MGDYRGQGSLFHDEGNTIARICSVNRQVSGASLPDSEQPDEQVQRAIECYANERARCDADFDQMPGELIGAFVELRVRKTLFFEGNSDGDRIAGGLFLD